jgi:plasmid maintenance system killer protein
MRTIFYKVMITAAMFFAVISSSFASDDITLLYFNHGDSVSLRWAPASEALFQRSVKSGYVVQRRNEGDADWTTISSKLTPLSQNEMDVMEAIDSDISVLKEIFYPSADRYTSEEPEDENVKLTSVPGKPAFEDGLLYAMALFTCDISKNAANAAALLFVDKNVTKNAKYEYRVVFADDEKTKNSGANLVKVDMRKLTVLPASSDFEGHPEVKYAHFEWSTANHVGFYSAYNVERSVDGKNFEPLRSRPFVQAYTDDKLADVAIFRDSFPAEEGTFYYRMKGYSPFGFYGPCSNVVKVEPKFVFESLQIDVDTVVVKRRSEEVQWSFDNKFEKKIKGFRISRTPDFKKFFYENDALIEPSKRKFKIDKKYDESQYYAVIAVGVEDKPEKRQEKQSSYFFSFRADTIPPAVPTGLNVTIDSAGVASIKWDANKEPDIQGYKLFVSNSGRDDDFFLITDTICSLNSYTDTLSLNTLTTSIYYRVNAIDLSYNSSQWSEPVKALKPDTIPPAPVVFRFLKQPNDKVVVEWENSPSDDLDYMELYRQIDDTGKVVLVKRFDLTKRKTPTIHEDDFGMSGVQVTYFMKIYDAVGNKSEARTNTLTTKGERPGCIGNLKVLITNLEKEKNIRLTWDITSKTSISRYVIYRKRNDEPMLDIASVRANQLYYVDERVAVGATYKYIVRAISQDRVCPAVYSEEVVFEGGMK